MQIPTLITPRHTHSHPLTLPLRITFYSAESAAINQQLLRCHMRFISTKPGSRQATSQRRLGAINGFAVPCDMFVELRAEFIFEACRTVCLDISAARWQSPCPPSGKLCVSSPVLFCFVKVTRFLTAEVEKRIGKC